MSKLGVKSKLEIMGPKDSLQELEKMLIKGLTEVKRKLVKFKKDKNSPFIVSKDGKVVEIDPEEIENKEEKPKE